MENTNGITFGIQSVNGTAIDIDQIFNKLGIEVTSFGDIHRRYIEAYSICDTGGGGILLLPCSWCGSRAPDDMRGNCRACGAPRK